MNTFLHESYSCPPPPAGEHASQLPDFVNQIQRSQHTAVHTDKALSTSRGAQPPMLCAMPQGFTWTSTPTVTGVPTGMDASMEQNVCPTTTMQPVPKIVPTSSCIHTSLYKPRSCIDQAVARASLWLERISEDSKMYVRNWTTANTCTTQQPRPPDTGLVPTGQNHKRRNCHKTSATSQQTPQILLQLSAAQRTAHEACRWPVQS
jgi:hypothetical protein